MKAMVAALVGDGAGVINLDAAVELIMAGGSGSLPHPALVEYCDRWITALWLGADLATMSAGSGQGQGASLQQGEIEALEQDDARELSETLNKRIDPQVIAYLFGEGVEPLAKIQIIPPITVDTAQELKVDQFLLDSGQALDKAETFERYNRSTPAPGSEVIARTATPAPKGDPIPDGNDAEGNPDPAIDQNPKASGANEAPRASFIETTTDKVAEALGDFFAPLRGEINRIGSLPDAEMLPELDRINAGLADYLKRRGVDDRAVEILGTALGQQVLLGLRGN